MSEGGCISSSMAPAAVAAGPSGRGLSVTDEGKQKEDKANIEERRSKKKTQNRIAQRAYREFVQAARCWRNGPLIAL